MPNYHDIERDTSRADALERLRRLAQLLDSAIRLPGGFRIGLDGIIGLIPWAGDALGAVLSAYIIVEAARLGVPNAVLLRMIGNVALETVVGFVPIAGDLFDFAWKANARNFALLERHVGTSTPGEAGNRRLLWLIGGLVALVILVVLVAFWALLKLVAAVLR